MYLQNADSLFIIPPLIHVENELDQNNRWVLLARQVPWSRLLRLYKKASLLYPELFQTEEVSRLIVGAFIVKCRENLSSERTIDFIRENPYVQYFLGFRLFKSELKIDRSLLISLLDKITDLLQQRNAERHNRKEILCEGFSSPKIMNKIAFHNLNGFVLIEPNDIVYIRADGNYSIFFLGRGQKEMVTQNIGKIFLKLDRKMFIRTKRSCIINSSYLSKINISQKMCVLSKDGEEFSCSISREQINEFSRHLRERRLDA